MSKEPRTWLHPAPPIQIEILLLGARQNKIPLIITSASDTGTNEGGDQYAQIVRDLVAKHNLGPLKMGLVKHDMTHDYLRDLLGSGAIIRGLDGIEPLQLRDIDRTARFVPVMGAEPIMRCLAEEPDVVITSRTSDCCPFAAFAMHHGYSRDLAYFWGKVLECRSGIFITTPSTKSTLRSTGSTASWVKWSRAKMPRLMKWG